MKDENNYLYEKKANVLQMPFDEYEKLIKQVAQTNDVKKNAQSALDGLKSALTAISSAPAFKVPPKGETYTPPVLSSTPKKESKSAPVAPAPEKKAEPKPAPEPAPAPEKKTEPAPAPAPEKKEEPKPAPEPAPAPEKKAESKPAAKPKKASAKNIPAIKKDILDHFKKADGSGKLFEVFKHYYAELNDACGGTVRVTIKDGICSIWNYDEWEEFAFVDIFEENLRIAVNPHYADRLKSLESCEVPRLLARRHNLVCIKTTEMDQTVLDVLITAFNEIGAIA